MTSKHAARSLSRQPNQTSATVVTKTSRTANALQICRVPAGTQLAKSHKHGIAEQDTNPQINSEQVRKHLLLQNLVPQETSICYKIQGFSQGARSTSSSIFFFETMHSTFAGNSRTLTQSLKD